MEDNNFNSPKEIQGEKLKSNKNKMPHSIKNKTQNTEENDNKTTNDVKTYKRKRKRRDISNFECKKEFIKKLPLILLFLLFLGIISSMIYLIIKLFFKKIIKKKKTILKKI